MKQPKFRVLVRNKDFKTLAEHTNLTQQNAIEKFKFYIDATLEFNLNVRVINLMKGNKTIKMFENEK